MGLQGRMTNPEIIFAVLAVVFAVGWFVQRNLVKTGKDYTPQTDDEKEKNVNRCTKIDTKCSKLNAALNNTKLS